MKPTTETSQEPSLPTNQQYFHTKSVQPDRFPKELEQAFREDYFRRNLTAQRRALLGLLLITLVFGLLNQSTSSSPVSTLLAIHYLFLSPLLALLLVATFYRNYQRWSDYVVASAGLVFGVTYIVMEWLSPTPAGSEASQTTVVLALIIMAACTVMPMQYVYAMSCTWTLWLLYSAASFTVLHLPNAFWNVGALLMACVLGSLGAAILNRSVRSDFLSRLAVEAEKQKLAEQNTFLDALAETRLQAARDVEHEIKNKLNAIGKPLEVASRYLSRGDTARPQGYIEDALQSVAELNRLLQMMLNIARMAAGHPPRLDEREVANLYEIVAEVCAKKQKELTLQSEAGQETQPNQTLPIIEVQTQQAPLSTWLHRYALGLVLENLIDNAVKYSPEGGTIRVSARQAEAHLMVCVSDQGIGIAPDRLTGLFDALYQRGRAEEYSITGTGIGLHLIKRLVDAQGGRIWAESKGEGQGASFFLTLPYQPTTTDKQPG